MIPPPPLLCPLAHPPPPAEARAGLDALARADPDLARIEAAAGPLPWRTRPVGFAGLLQAIVAQQISSAAAAAIWRRLQAIAGASDPAGLLALPDSVLLAAGLSRPKLGHARALACAFVEQRLRAEAIATLPDEAAIALLTSVRGLGRWSAEVYLLFALGRADVFPAGDVALAAAAAALKSMPARPAPPALRALADRAWQPYRGLAARLLWHHWRHLTGRPAMDDLPVASLGPSDTAPGGAPGTAAASAT